MVLTALVYYSILIRAVLTVIGNRIARIDNLRNSLIKKKIDHKMMSIM